MIFGLSGLGFWVNMMAENDSGDDNAGFIPAIETERLRLREWRVSDFEGYLTLKTDAELQRYVLGGATDRLQTWDDFCAISGQWVLRGVGIFLVADIGTDQPRGFAGLWYPLDIESPELCWSLFPGSMGKGYATEAAGAARKWVYENSPYQRLVSYVHPDNSASRAVAKRLGAEVIDRIRLYGEDRLVFLHPDPSSI